MVFGEELSDDEAFITVWVKEAVWVRFDNEELIALYGLEEANFDNDYELYSGDEFEWKPLFKNVERQAEEIRAVLTQLHEQVRQAAAEASAPAPA